MKIWCAREKKLTVNPKSEPKNNNNYVEKFTYVSGSDFFVFVLFLWTFSHYSLRNAVLSVSNSSQWWAIFIGALWAALVCCHLVSPLYRWHLRKLLAARELLILHSQMSRAAGREQNTHSRLTAIDSFALHASIAIYSALRSASRGGVGRVDGVFVRVREVWLVRFGLSLVIFGQYAYHRFLLEVSSQDRK